MKKRDTQPRRPAPPARGVLGRPSLGVTHHRLLPAPPLADVIAHFWSVQWDLEGLAPVISQTLPHPSVHLIAEGGQAQVAGVMTRRFSRTLEGQGGVIGIKVRPGMFHGFIAGPVKSLANRVVNVAEVFGRAGVDLSRALATAQGQDERRIELAEAFLLGRLPPADPWAVLARDLVEQMATDRALLRVEQVAARAKLTLRTLQRLFSRYVGVGPKWVLQRYRLHEAAEQLARDATSSPSTLAAELGYADQAHFVRDFRALVGQTPGVYAREIRSQGKVLGAKGAAHRPSSVAPPLDPG